jgi:transcriptional regulator with XRE-family HTH domain
VADEAADVSMGAGGMREPFTNPPSTPFNAILIEARIANGMSVKDVAHATGFTPTFVRAYEECYKNPTVSTLFKLCRALNLSFTIGPDGVSATDLHNEVELLTRWKPQ